MYLEKHKRLYKFTIVGDLSFHGSKLKLKGVMKIGLLNSISYKILKKKPPQRETAFIKLILS